MRYVWFDPPPRRRARVRWMVAALAVGLAACASSSTTAGRATGPATRGIEAAALPYRIVDAHTGREVEAEAFWSALGAARAVCVGEEHPNPHHHWAQLEVVDHLEQRRPVAVGLEMVQRPFQGVLDDWAAHRIDDRALVSRTGWEDRWGYDFAMYRPILARAVAAGAPVLALNAPRELTKKISKSGLAALSAEERAQLPALELNDAKHRAWFDGVMAEMGGAAAHREKKGGDAARGGGGDKGKRGEDAEDADDRAKTERIYSVQVVWDETMADGAAQWLAGGPERGVVILAGGGHCHDAGIVGRLKRRGVTQALSVQPIIDDGESVAAALAAPINDYLFVMSTPAR